METAQATIERDIRRLQQDAAHGKVPVSALLRRALVLARAKADTEFESWLRKEIDGYDPKDRSLPDYREVPCVLNCWNPHRGWMPVQFVEPKDAKRWSARGNVQGVEVLEGLVGDPRKAKTPLVMELPPEASAALAKGSNYPNPRYVQFVSSTSIDSILASVRNRVLDWTLTTSIHGEDVSFKSMMTDALSVTRGGKVLCKIKGRVDPVNSRVITFETSTPIQEGDIIVQHLPNGAEEKFDVLAPGFQSGHGGIPDSYQASVQRVASRPRPGPAPTPGSTVINIHGDHGRAYLGSTDNSTNTISTHTQVWAEVESVIEKAPEAVRAELAAKAKAAKDAQGTPSYGDRWNDFMAKAANYCTVLGTLFPTIAALLQRVAPGLLP